MLLPQVWPSNPNGGERATASTGSRASASWPHTVWPVPTAYKGRMEAMVLISANMLDPLGVATSGGLLCLGNGESSRDCLFSSSVEATHARMSQSFGLYLHKSLECCPRSLMTKRATSDST